ncbi:MAG: hypothetical protein Q9161_007317 [Pseudevernia consocians]
MSCQPDAIDGLDDQGPPILTEVGVILNAGSNYSLVSKTSVIAPAEAMAVQANGYFEFSIFPQHAVTVTKEWAAYLNPSIPSTNTNLFYHLMALDISSIRVTTNVKTILTGLLADNGLSGIGSTSKLQDTMKTVTKPDGSPGIDGDYWFSRKGNTLEVDVGIRKDDSGGTEGRRVLRRRRKGRRVCQLE